MWAFFLSSLSLHRIISLISFSIFSAISLIWFSLPNKKQRRQAAGTRARRRKCCGAGECGQRKRALPAREHSQRTRARPARTSVAGMGGFNSWEYPTILVHLYVYMYVYLYIHMYNAIFYNTFAHSSPKQLKKRPFSLASAVSTDHSLLVKAPCCSPFCLCSCNFQPKI